MIKRSALSIMRLFCTALLFSILCESVVIAQTDSIIVGQAQQWEKIKGSAVHIGVSGKGRVAAVDRAGDVYRYIHQEDRWQRIGQNMTQIAGGVDGDFWGIDRQQNLRHFTGTQWAAIGSGAHDIALDKDGNVYVATNTSSIAKYNVRRKNWQRIAGTATQIAISAQDMIWVIDDKGKLARKLDDAWISLDIEATDIFSDMSGRLFIIKPDQKLYLWDDTYQQAIAYTAAQTAQNFVSGAANKDQVWVLTPQNTIYASGHENYRLEQNEGIIENRGGNGHSEEAEIVDPSPMVFELVSNTQTLSDIDIGRDGSIYGLTSSGVIRRWSNGEDRFYDFPGTLKTILVQPSGLPLGIGKNDNLLEHDGEAWRQVNLAEKLIDLALYDDGHLLAVSNDERVIRVSEGRQSFALLGTRAQQIVAHEDGSYWVIDPVKRVFKCTEEASCTQKNIQAEDIAVGPAGSVFVVDTANALRRYDAHEDIFEIIPQNQKLSRVALGPKDRAWVINTQGKVYAANYFERDESADRKLAIKTKATANVTTEQPNVGGSNSGVQITQSISFNAVNVPTSASGFSNLGSGLFDLTVGADDIVLVSGYDDGCIDGTGRNWAYNAQARAFSHLDYLKRANMNVLLAVDKLLVGAVNGTVPPTTPPPAIPSLVGEWNKACSDKSTLLTYVASVFEDPSAQASQNFDAATFSTELDLGQLPDLDYAADGYVANIAPNAEIEFFKPETADNVSFFDELNFMRIGIGKTHKDLWVVSTTYNVYEYNESTNSFDLRSFNADDRAQDIGVGQDGSVFIVNKSGVLKKWDEVSKRFIKTNKSGVTRVAVDSLGKPIVANFPSSQTVYFGR